MTTWTTKVDGVDKVMADHVNKLQTYKLDRDVVVRPEDYGAVGDGVTDDTAAINAAITAANHGGAILLSNKTYLVTSEISFANKEFITVRGTSQEGGSTITSDTPGLRSVVSLLGAQYINFENFDIESMSAANAPKAILILGRTVATAGGAGNHRFARFKVRGYATKAAVYSIASECNSWENPYIILIGGGAKYCYYTSQSDELSLGGFTTETNLSNFFNHFYFWNLSVGADNACIYINGTDSCGDFYFRDGYLAGAGSLVRIYSHNADDAYGQYVFHAIRGESYGTLVQGFYLDGEAGSTIFRLSIQDCNFAYPTDWFIYGTDAVTISAGVWMNNLCSVGSSVKTASDMFVFEHYHNITFRTSATNSIIYMPDYTYTASLGVSASMNQAILSGAAVSSYSGFDENDATPSVKHGNNFATYNTAATTITNFDDGWKGQCVRVVIADNNTVVDFTGTYLKGNDSLAWHPLIGDVLYGLYDGAIWHCIVNSPTIIPCPIFTTVGISNLTPAFVPYEKAGAELLTDGELEIWASATNLTNWTEVLSGTSTVNKEAVDFHGGSFSCRCDIDASNDYAYIYQAVTLVPSHKYTLSFWYKTAAGKSGSAKFEDDLSNVFMDSGGAWHATTQHISLPTAVAWTKISIPFTAHASYADYNILIGGYPGLIAASSSIYIDDISIIPDTVLEDSPISTDGTIVNVANLVSYANDAAAGAAGLGSGDLYTETGTDPLRLAVKT